MSLNHTPALDAQALSRAREDTTAPTSPTRDVESAPLATAGPAHAVDEPSPSERLYEAYRLWAFTGR